MTVKMRDSKYELLRIIATVAITLNHVPCSKNAIYFNQLLRKFFFLGGQFGVNLFVILGAWFLSSSQFNSKRIIRIIEQTLFYSILLDIVAMLLGGNHLTIRQFLKSFSYWFCFGYVVMLLMIPFLQKLTYRTKLTVTVVGAVITSIVTILGYVDSNLLIVKLFGKGILIGPVWFCYSFVVVNLIKNKWQKIKITAYEWLILFVVTYFLMYVILILTDISFIREVHSPICYLSSLSAFGFISTLDIGYNKNINKLAGYTFGAYLFQSHMILRKYLWEDLFRFTEVSEKYYIYGIEGIIAVIVIFVLTICIDEIRAWMMNSTPVKSIEEKLCLLCDNMYTKICNI